MLPSMWDLPGSGMEPVSLALAGGFFTTEPPGKPHISFLTYWPWFSILPTMWTWLHGHSQLDCGPLSDRILDSQSLSWSFEINTKRISQMIPDPGYIKVCKIWTQIRAMPARVWETANWNCEEEADLQIGEHEQRCINSGHCLCPSFYEIQLYFLAQVSGDSHFLSIQPFFIRTSSLSF